MAFTVNIMDRHVFSNKATKQVMTACQMSKGDAVLTFIL